MKINLQCKRNKTWEKVWIINIYWDYPNDFIKIIFFNLIDTINLKKNKKGLTYLKYMLCQRQEKQIYEKMKLKLPQSKSLQTESKFSILLE